MAHKTAHTLRNGLLLGRVRFTATPKLSVFLCLLMTVTALVLSLVTSVTYDSRTLFNERTMFTHIPGRTVIVRRDGKVITDEELEKLASDIGAKDYLHYDSMLDTTKYFLVGEDRQYYEFSFGYPAKSIDLDEGRYPEADNEVILEVPISAKPQLGENGFEEIDLPFPSKTVTFRVVGVSYYYDNTRTPRMLFTENGYKIASAAAFYDDQQYNFDYDIGLSSKEHPQSQYAVHIGGGGATIVDFGLPEKTYYINDSALRGYLIDLGMNKGETKIPDHISVKTELKGSFYNYVYEDYYYEYYGDVMVDSIKPSYGDQETFTYEFADCNLVWDISDHLKTVLEESFTTQWEDDLGIQYASFVVISPDILLDFMYENYYTQAYTQASLFFENDREAHDKVEALRDLGYTAVVSDETVESDVFDVLFEKLSAGSMAVMWLLAIGFISLFLSLCSSRAMNATRGDVAIMRSMGIPTIVVRISIYVQTLIALIPAAIVTAIACAVVYTTPATNYMFPFLHAADYFLIAAVLVLIALNLSHRYVKRMFSDSVKKTLKGGNKV